MYKLIETLKSINSKESKDLILYLFYICQVLYDVEINFFNKYYFYFEKYTYINLFSNINKKEKNFYKKVIKKELVFLKKEFKLLEKLLKIEKIVKRENLIIYFLFVVNKNKNINDQSLEDLNTLIQYIEHIDSEELFDLFFIILRKCDNFKNLEYYNSILKHSINELKSLSNLMKKENEKTKKLILKIVHKLVVLIAGSKNIEYFLNFFNKMLSKNAYALLIIKILNKIEKNNNYNFKTIKQEFENFNEQLQLFENNRLKILEFLKKNTKVSFKK